MIIRVWVAREGSLTSYLQLIFHLLLVILPQLPHEFKLDNADFTKNIYNIRKTFIRHQPNIRQTWALFQLLN